MTVLPRVRTSLVLCVATAGGGLVDMVLTSIVLLVSSVSAQAPRVCSRAFAFRGHMGCDTITTKNLEVVRVDEDMNLFAQVHTQAAKMGNSSHSYGLNTLRRVFRYDYY